MTSELSNFGARLRGLIAGGKAAIDDQQFSQLALELFSLQFEENASYRKICKARGLTPAVVEHWTQIPAVPTTAFKELELSCILPGERTAVFHSSGTTEQKPSRHFHCAESLALYQTSLWQWFQENCRLPIADCRLICLTPPAEQMPHSSLVHMFETIRQKVGTLESVFIGKIGMDGTWTLDFDEMLAVLNLAISNQQPAILLGTAFSFVHLLDFLAANNIRFKLPAGSRVVETGGYKNRSRTMPKAELHALITERLGVPPENIICEYGMSELSSQAYDSATSDESRVARSKFSRHPSPATRHFHFPPWARAQIISPETGREVADGETGLIRVFDLANVFSVMAVQTEDLAVRHGDGFELIGRDRLAEPRGCSLMSVEVLNT